MLTDGMQQDLFEKGEFRVFPDIPGLKSGFNNGSLFLTSLKWKNQVLLMPHNANMIVRIDSESFHAEGHRIRLPGNDILKHLSKYQIVLAERDFPLKEYIKMVADGERKEVWQSPAAGAIGRAVFEAITDVKRKR